MGTDLARALFGKTRCSILALLCARPQQSFYLREIVRSARTGPGAVQRELAHLVSAGLVRRFARGNQVHFQCDEKSPIFAELRSIMLKTAGLVDVLRDSLTDDPRIRIAFVFGSIADGRASSDSDVDLCVVGNLSFAETTEMTARAEAALGREVNPTVYPVAEFQDKLTTGHHFVSRITGGPKLFVVGDEDELARLAEERLDRGAPARPRGNRRPARRR